MKISNTILALSAVAFLATTMATSANAGSRYSMDSHAQPAEKSEIMVLAKGKKKGKGKCNKKSCMKDGPGTIVFIPKKKK